jgi:hypothetical protein
MDSRSRLSQLIMPVIRQTTRHTGDELPRIERCCESCGQPMEGGEDGTVTRCSNQDCTTRSRATHAPAVAPNRTNRTLQQVQREFIDHLTRELIEPAVSTTPAEGTSLTEDNFNEAYHELVRGQFDAIGAPNNPPARRNGADHWTIPEPTTIQRDVIRTEARETGRELTEEEQIIMQHEVDRVREQRDMMIRSSQQAQSPRRPNMIPNMAQEYVMHYSMSGLSSLLGDFGAPQEAIYGFIIISRDEAHRRKTKSIHVALRIYRKYVQITGEAILFVCQFASQKHYESYKVLEKRAIKAKGWYYDNRGRLKHDPEREIP